MNTDPIKIVEFDNLKHRKQVVELWQDVFGYEAGHNQPEVAIDKKIAAGDGLFFVAVKQETVAGTVMAGYDGHRGWINYLAVHPQHQRAGVAAQLMDEAA
ncbi:hypothetical protein LCGC14_3042330, partial [marine sediment metagenome]